MLSRFSVKKPFTVIVAIIIISILGVISYMNIGVDMLPGMNLPYVAVVTVYPGAAPETVESEITNPLEEALSEVANIKNMTSTSAEHYSMVMLEFNADANLDNAYADVNEKLQSVVFPESELLQEPIVMKINPNMLPVMSVSVAMDGKTIKESADSLNKAVEKIKSVDGVSSVSTSGMINDLVYISMSVDSLSDTLVQYLYDTFGIKLAFPDDAKTEILSVMREQNWGEMTEEKIIDILIEYVENNAATPAEGTEFVWSDTVLSALNQAKDDPENSYIYQLCSQLIANKFIFKETSDDALFYSFIDQITHYVVYSYLDNQVGSVFEQISPSVLSQLIYAQNFEMPAGSVTEGVIETVVKIGPTVVSREEFLQMPVISFDMGASYADRFNNIYTFLSMAAAIGGGDSFSFNETQLLGYVVAIRAAVATDENNPLYSYFDTHTNDEVMEDVKNVLVFLSGLAEEGTVTLPSEDNEIYIVNIPKLKSTVEKVQDMLVVPLKLSSFADVTFFDNSTQSLTYLLTKAMNNDDEIFVNSGAVIVSINKEPNKSTVEVTNGIIEVLSDIDTEIGMEDFTYTVLSNDGNSINFMLDTVLSNLLFGALFAILILLLFLKNIKGTIVVGSSIFISVIFTFVMMYFAGITLNIVSMGGLALGIGMLVDNSIVVLENIYRVKAQGKDIYVAAIQGAKQVASAIIASTLTTMIVFLPIAFISGLTKEIFTDMALTICFSLLASLIVALTLVPMASSTFMKKPPRPESKAMKKFKKGYAKLLNASLRYKFVPIILVVVLFAGSIFAVFKMDLVLFPASDSSTMSITASVSRTGLAEYNVDKTGDEYMSYDEAVDFTMSQIRSMFNGDILVLKNPDNKKSELAPYGEIYDSKWINDINAVGLYVTNGLSVQGFNLGEQSISVKIILNDEKSRNIGSLQLSKIFDEILNKDEVNKGIFTYSVSNGDMLSSLGLSTDSYSVKMTGENLDALRKDADNFSSLFKTIGADGKTSYNVDGITSISTGLESNSKEYRIIVDRAKANKYGLTVAQVYLQVSAALSTVSSDSSISLFTDDISSSGEIFIYDISYVTTTWYNCTDPEGNNYKVFVKNNTSDKQSIADYYVASYSNKGLFLIEDKETEESEQSYHYVPVNSSIPVKASENGFEYTYVYENSEGVIEKETVKLTKQGEEVYYSTGLADAFDLMTMPIHSEDMLNSGAGIKTVPLYKILSDDCFIKNKDGNVIYRTNDFGTIEEVPYGFVKEDAYLAITHAGKQRIMTVNFEYDTDVISGNDVEKMINEKMSDYEFDKSVTIEASSGNPYMAEVFTTMAFILGLAIVLIYLIMVAQFQSLKSPLIIMVTIPLAFTGGIFAILLAGEPLSIMALMGLIVLMGVVVNNGIVFVDYCNQLIRKGVPKRIALIRTGIDRIRPILMTALTTIVALIMMAVDGSEGGAMLQPLAITSIGGMIFSTLLTLFMVPIIYDILNKKGQTERDKVFLNREKFDADGDDGLEEWDKDSEEFVYSLKGVSNTITEPKEKTTKPHEGFPTPKVFPTEHIEATTEKSILESLEKRSKDVFEK